MTIDQAFEDAYEDAITVTAETVDIPQVQDRRGNRCAALPRSRQGALDLGQYLGLSVEKRRKREGLRAEAQDRDPLLVVIEQGCRNLPLGVLAVHLFTGIPR